ncbi:MAG: transposase [candidate division WOR-3 bacterium]
MINKTFPEISQEDRIGLKYFCEELINYLMGREREDFLKKIEEDKGNGYHFRNLLTGSGLLELEVPRTRNGNFRPSLLLEKYKRFSDGFDGFLFSLISAGYSPDQISRALKRLN